MRKACIYALSALTAILIASIAFAAVGDEIATMSFPEGTDCSLGVGVAFDGEFLYYTYVCDTNLYKIRPDGTGHAVIATTGVAEYGLAALSYDATRNKIWAGTYGCDTSGGGPVYLIDQDTGVATYMFSVPSAYIMYCLDDGVAYDATDDSIWYSDDVQETMVHMATDGTELGTVDLCAVDARLCSWPVGYGNSGIAIGGDNFYLGNNGGFETLRVDRDTLTLLDDFVNTDYRIEDMECDPDTYSPTEVMWIRDAYAGTVRAYEIEPGTCGLGGKEPECASAPLAYWSFDDEGNPGKDDYDGHHGTVNGATWTATGKINGALDFDGVDDDVVVPDDSSLSGMSALTVSCWFNAESFTSEEHGNYLVSKDIQGDGNNLSDSYHLALVPMSDGHVGLHTHLWSGTHVWGYPSEECTLVYSTDISTSEWHHAAVTYDGATVRLYLDGNEVASSPFVAPLGHLNITPSTDLTIGEVTGPYREAHFDGRIDEVHLLDRALSCEEIACLANLNTEEVSEAASVRYSGVRFNRVTMIMSGNCTITNVSADTLGVPMKLVIEDTGHPSVTVANADGTTCDGQPYFDFSGSLSGDGELTPGEASAPRVIEFHNPSRVRFRWTKSVWAVVK